MKTISEALLQELLRYHLVQMLCKYRAVKMILICHGLPCNLSLFRNKFNKFNNTGVQMLDSV